MQLSKHFDEREMLMVGISMFSWFSYQLSIEERIQKIRNAGFKAVTLWWGSIDNEEQQPDIARRYSLDIDNIHTPFENPNSLWLDKIEGEDYLDTLISCVKACRRHSIPTAVIHLSKSSQYTPPTAIGIKRVMKLVEYAEKMEVNLAFENINTLDHLEYVFDTIDSCRVGFCFDCGHEHYWHPDADCLTRYGHRLFAVHLHDNDGKSDAHLLPYDGTINWTKLRNKLSGCSPLKYYTLEADFDPEHECSKAYKNLTADEFLALAYKRSQRFVLGEDNE